MNTPCETSDLLVFSDLKWDQPLRRPHHLLSRYAKRRKVFFIEQPTTGASQDTYLQVNMSPEGVAVVTPFIPTGLDENSKINALEALLNNFIGEEEISNFTALYHTSQALTYTRSLCPSVILFDYSETHSDHLDEELTNKAHLVFSLGHAKSKYKKTVWNNMISYPSSVDYDHFFQSRKGLKEPEDQKNIPYPRIGFYGKMDETFNSSLLEKMAQMRPEFQFVILNENNLENTSFPKRENIHYLGSKNYYELPSYLSGWDCAFLPYSVDESSKLFSPEQIPELLSSAIPIVSTSLYDSIHPYSDSHLIYIADHPEHFVQSIENAINDSIRDPEWIDRVDQYLADVSWDSTFELMAMLEIKVKQMMQNIRPPAYEDSSLSAIGIV